MKIQITTDHKTAERINCIIGQAIEQIKQHDHLADFFDVKTRADLTKLENFRTELVNSILEK